MPDSDFIPASIGNQPVSSGVTMNSGMSAIQRIGNAGQAVLGAAQKHEALQEKFKREDNQRSAEADLSAFSAHATEAKAALDVALTKVSDPEKIDSMITDYNKNMDNFVSGKAKNGVANFRNQLGKKNAERGLVKHKADLNAQVTGLKAANDRKQDISRFETKVTQIKLNPTDPNYMANLSTTYDVMVDAGYMLESQKTKQMALDKEQHKIAIADNTTAVLQLGLREETKKVSGKIANLWTSMADKKISVEDANKETDRLIKDYQTNISAEAKQYEKFINNKDLGLSNVEKFNYLNSMKTSAGVSNNYLKGIKDQVKIQQVRQENANIMGYQEWVSQNLGKTPTLQVYKSFGLPDKFIMAEQKTRNTALKSKAKAQEALKNSNDVRTAVIFGGDFTDMYGKKVIAPPLTNLNPDSDPKEINKYLTWAAGITDNTMRTQVESAIKDRINPLKYDKPIQDYMTSLRDKLQSDLEANKSIYKEDTKWGPQNDEIFYNKSMIANQVYNLEKETASIYRQAKNTSPETAFEVAKRHYTDRLIDIANPVTQNGFNKRYFLVDDMPIDAENKYEIKQDGGRAQLQLQVDEEIENNAIKTYKPTKLTPGRKF